MNILFVNFHPVDSQIVRFVAKELIIKQYNVLFAFAEKEGIIQQIIEYDNFKHAKIGKSKSSIQGKIINILQLGVRLTKIISEFKPDIIFSPTSLYSGLIAKLYKIPVISWGDTETATTNLKYSLPFIDSLLIPNCFYAKLKNNNKVVRFNGYKELAYLHPNWFKPDKSVLEKLNLKIGDKFVLMRFSALHAMHDIGLKSVGDNYREQILNYIKEIEKYAKVYISTTERDPGEEFKKYELKIHPSEYIHFLSFCSLYIGEGTTTASEAGVLGVPWINIQKTTRGYLIDQEKNYKLGFRTDNVDKAFQTAIEWIQKDDLKIGWQVKRDKLLNDKIDVSSFFIWFIENYPESHKIMKENPSEIEKRFHGASPKYQSRFK